MKQNMPTGAQELAFLRYVADHGPLSAGRVAEVMGADGGPARSTVITVLERLRRKGLVTRKRAGGVFEYASAIDGDSVLRRAVGQFVERSLSGSVSPFVAYLAERGKVSADELRELEQLVAKLKPSHKGEA